MFKVVLYLSTIISLVHLLISEKVTLWFVIRFKNCLGQDHLAAKSLNTIANRGLFPRWLRSTKADNTTPPAGEVRWEKGEISSGNPRGTGDGSIFLFLRPRLRKLPRPRISLSLVQALLPCNTTARSYRQRDIGRLTPGILYGPCFHSQRTFPPSLLICRKPLNFYSFARIHPNPTCVYTPFTTRLYPWQLAILVCLSDFFLGIVLYPRVHPSCESRSKILGKKWRSFCLKLLQQRSTYAVALARIISRILCHWKYYDGLAGGRGFFENEYTMGDPEFSPVYDLLKGHTHVIWPLCFPSHRIGAPFRLCPNNEMISCGG